MVHNGMILLVGFVLMIGCLIALVQFDVMFDVGEVAPDVAAPQSPAEMERVKVDCPECRGTGMRIEEADPEFLPGVYLEVNGQCPMCGGSGKLIKEPDR